MRFCMSALVCNDATGIMHNSRISAGKDPFLFINESLHGTPQTLRTNVLAGCTLTSDFRSK